MSLSEEEAQAPLTPQVGRKPRGWVWAGLVGVATVGALAAVALSRTQKKRSSIHRFANAVRAFSVRALEDKPDFVSSGIFTFNQVDAEVPSKTGMKFVLQQSEEEYEGKDPVLKAIFHAKEGKGKELAEQLAKARDALCKEQAGEHGDEAEGACKSMLSIEQVEEADEAALTMVIPEDEDSEKGMEESLKSAADQKPKFEVELFFGNTIKEMFDSRHDVPLPLLPKGVHASMNVAIPSSMATDVAKEMGEGQQCPYTKALQSLFSGFASQTVKYELLYKSEEELGSTWASLPTTDMAWDQLISASQQIPPSVREVLHGLDELADGLKSVSFSNLPEKLEIVGEFTNFKVSEVIKAVLDAKPAPAWYVRT